MFSNEIIYLQRIFIHSVQKFTLYKNSFLQKKVHFTKKKNDSGKGIHSVKNISCYKKGHSLRNKFYFQFSFTINEEVKESEKIYSP